MNRMSSRQRRTKFVMLATILLFTFLMVGLSVFPSTSIGSAFFKVSFSKMLVKLHSEWMYEFIAERYDLQKPVRATLIEESEFQKEQVMSSKDTKEQVLSTKHKKEQALSTHSARESENNVSEGFEYNPEIPMPKEHQAYLYKLSKERGIDYEKALAIIKHESGFDPNEISETDDYGYFQVNKINHERLSEALNTPNDPLDPFVNINWGTYLLAELYEKWKEKGYRGNRLDEIVWSCYNRGERGYYENGVATNYVKKVRSALQEIQRIS